MVKFDSAGCDLAKSVYQRFGQRWSQRFKLRQDTISAALFWGLKGWDWDKVRSTLLECLWYTDLPFGHTFTGPFGNLSGTEPHPQPQHRSINWCKNIQAALWSASVALPLDGGPLPAWHSQFSPEHENAIATFQTRKLKQTIEGKLMFDWQACQ